MTDNTIQVRADITDDPDAIHTDDGAQDDQNVVIPPPPAAGAAGQTTLAFSSGCNGTLDYKINS